MTASKKTSKKPPPKPAKKKTTTKRKTTKKKVVESETTSEPPVEAPQEEPPAFLTKLQALAEDTPLGDIAPYLGKTLYEILYPEQAPAASAKKSKSSKKSKSKSLVDGKTPRQLVAEARRQEILAFMQGKTDVTKGDLVAAFPDDDPQAIWRALSRLSLEGKIEATGTTRNRVYNVA